MKTLGIIGGLGPESTIDYYRSIVSLYREKMGEGYPPLIIVSLNVDKGIRLLNADALDELGEYIAGGVRSLAAAGAEFALVAANSPHIAFDAIRRLSPLPLISIVESTCQEVKRRGFTRVALLGTRFTMAGRFYPEVFETCGIDIVPPSPEEQAYIHEKYLAELLLGKFLDQTRAGLQQIIARMKERDAVQAIVLAGTELPLILRADSVAGLPLLDTTQIHVAAAVTQMLSTAT